MRLKYWSNSGDSVRSYLSSPPPASASYYEGGYPAKISPSILLIILILAIIFFVSGLLHLLIRFLLRPSAGGRSGGSEESGRGGGGGSAAVATAFQGQLRQLFHLHDAGVDQAFIDALPVFLYRAVVGGGKDPFDCAVCLCEFAGDDRLRLLPKCSHAFHVECIDTWLLSHSTCPLCRSSLLVTGDLGAPFAGSPLVLLLESDGDQSSLENSMRHVPALTSGSSIAEEDTIASIGGSSRRDSLCKAITKDEPDQTPAAQVVVPVKLGKFRSGSGEENSGGGGGSEIDQRRCYSMGTYEYVVQESSALHVAVAPPRKPPPPLAASGRKPGHRLALSESSETHQCPASGAGSTKKESYSVSKIWIRRSAAAPSFRWPWTLPSAADSDAEVGSCRRDSVSSSRADDPPPPAPAKRTLRWILSKQ